MSVYLYGQIFYHCCKSIYLGIFLNLNCFEKSCFQFKQIERFKIQGSKGINQLPKKMMYIPNDNKQNHSFRKLQLIVETIGHSNYWTNQFRFNRSSKMLSQRIRKRYLKTCEINSPMSPFSLYITALKFAFLKYLKTFQWNKRPIFYLIYEVILRL